MVKDLRNILSQHSDYFFTDEQFKNSLFSIHKLGDKYSLSASDVVFNKDMAGLKQKIKDINKIEKHQTSENIEKKFSNINLYEKERGVQKVMKIAKHMGTELQYEFKKIDDKHSYFYLNTEVPMQKESIPNNLADYKNPIENFQELKDIFENNEIILFFKGAFNQKSLLNLLSTVESQLNHSTVTTKIYNLMVEMLQNISKHADYFTEEVNWKPGIFLITETEDKFVLTSGNYVANDKLDKLRKKIDFSNSLNENELIKEYNRILQNFSIDQKRGLGLLDLRRKSKSNLDCFYHTIDEKFTFFIIQVNVLKQKILNALIIEETQDTPRVHFDPRNNIFELSRKSLPEDASDFYEPVVRWLKEYSLRPNKKTDFVFKFEYYNTTSSLYISKIIAVLVELSKTTEVKVYWYHNKMDEDMMNNGLDFMNLNDLDMDVIAY